MDQLLEWPSKRIPHGGVFHYPKVQYSQETQDILKVLMNESKFTLRQQKEVNWCLRSGSSLNDATSRAKSSRAKSAPTCLKNPPKITRRRSYFEIKSSGDFEREKFIPNQRNEDREVIKSRLQEIMEYGKDPEYHIKTSKSKLDGKKNFQEKKLPGKYEILQELLKQIKDRSDWLEEMEALGSGAKHREVIQHQIAERMRKIDALKLPQNIMDLKIDEDESAIESESMNTKRTNFDGSSRSEKKTIDRTKVQNNNIECDDESQKSVKYKKNVENIADILYPI